MAINNNVNNVYNNNVLNKNTAFSQEKLSTFLKKVLDDAPQTHYIAGLEYIEVQP